MSEIKEIDCSTAHQTLSQYRIIDVREPSEWAGELGCISQAELISMGNIPRSCRQWDRSQAILMVCRSGKRSRHTTQYLMNEGFTHVVNMSGGMIAWNMLSLPAAPR